MVRAFVSAGISAVLGIFNGIRGIVGTVAGAMSGVFSTISGVFGSIMGFVSGMVGRFIGIGGDIIRGMANGIRAAGGAILDAIISIIPGPVRKFLGIGSPSKLMAEIAGVPMAEGIAMGMVQGKKSIVSAMEKIVPSLNVQPGGGFDVSGGGGMIGRGGAGGGGGDTSNQVTNNINGNITLGDQSAVDRFWDRLNRDAERAAMGAPPTA
jgi:hypothetical protein